MRPTSNRTGSHCHNTSAIFLVKRVVPNLTTKEKVSDFVGFCACCLYLSVGWSVGGWGGGGLVCLLVL